MDIEKQLKLQAFLDGELPEDEAREIANLVARDQEAAALVAELRNTRQAIAASEQVMQLPESREFFWSKIQREIEHLEPVETVQEKASWLAAWRRFLVPAGAIAAVCVAFLVSVGPNGGRSGPESESSTADTSAFTYHDYGAQATLVWFSYPAENEVADNEPASTLQ